MHSIHKAALFLNLNNLLNLWVFNFFLIKRLCINTIYHEKTLYNTIYFKEKNNFSIIFQRVVRRFTNRTNRHVTYFASVLHFSCKVLNTKDLNDSKQILTYNILQKSENNIEE